MYQTTLFKQCTCTRGKKSDMARNEIIANHSNVRIRKILTCNCLPTVIGSSGVLFAQEELNARSAPREYVESEQRANYDALLAEYGNNKQLPKGFELQTLLALQHYPALRDVRIDFIVDDVSIPLSSRPQWRSMLRSAYNQNYQEIIANIHEGYREH